LIFFQKLFVQVVEKIHYEELAQAPAKLLFWELKRWWYILKTLKKGLSPQV